MAKGKHAVLAANARYKAAIEHIDRLTSEMADMKVRMKVAEADAMAAPGLRKEVERLRNDHVVAEIVEKVEAAFKDRDRQIAAWKKARPDFIKMMNDVAKSHLVDTSIDAVEFWHRRYPRLFAFLDHRDEEILAHWKAHPRHLLKLSHEAARRYERAAGMRAIHRNSDRDAADVAVDLCDVVRMDLTKEEMRELIEETR
jgi:hypothetical protein